MGAPHKFLRKLHEVFGAEATDAMAEWMNRTDDKFDELRADIAELRQEMNVNITEIREEMRVGFARVDARFAAMDAKMDAKFAEFMKWTLGFWVASLVTYVAALMALARVLR
jgi:predicted  nucleic acid-binding Zn-ribbon protein